MRCVICNIEVPTEKNSVVCSDKCKEVRLLIFRLIDKYFPQSGCDNCWGDLGGSCSEECHKSSSAGRKFAQDLWSIIKLIYPVKAGEREGKK